MSAIQSASTHATPLSKPDEDLAREAAADDMDAFEELVRRRRSGLVRFLASFTQSAADADDLVQETFLRAYRNLANYDPRKPFLPWLYVIARRLAINLFRKRLNETVRSNIGESELTPTLRLDGAIPLIKLSV